jgi:hypothetical protein
MVVTSAVKLAASPQPCKLTIKFCAVPTQRLALVSVTEIVPLDEPKLTVMLLLLGPVAPLTMLAPLGTVHA